MRAGAGRQLWSLRRKTAFWWNTRGAAPFRFIKAGNGRWSSNRVCSAGGISEGTLSIILSRGLEWNAAAFVESSSHSVKIRRPVLIAGGGLLDMLPFYSWGGLNGHDCRRNLSRVISSSRGDVRRNPEENWPKYTQGLVGKKGPRRKF